MKGRGFKTKSDVPCPICYAPMVTVDDHYECKKHGQPKDKMPYKEKSKHQEAQGFSKAARTRNKWIKMGLEILEEKKTLICLTCRRETRFFSSDLFRHEDDCPMRADSLALIDKTEEQTKWSRRNGHRRDK
jgi:hypothetical protein